MSNIDPTKIDIKFDPTLQYMHGVTAHGNWPFNVPFISKINDHLWQGGCESSLILPKFITDVVSLYRWEGYHVNHQLSSSMTITMYDSNHEPDIDEIEAIARWVNIRQYLSDDAVVLIHCQAGLNRSGLVAAVSLVLDERNDIKNGSQAIELLQAQRSSAVLCNPSFNKWIVKTYG